MARYKSRTRPFRVPVSSHVTDREDSGVQLDEPSSPISRQFDTNIGDGGKQSCKDNSNLMIQNVVKSSSQGDIGNKVPRRRYIYDEDYKGTTSFGRFEDFSTSMRNQNTDLGTKFMHGTECSSILKKKTDVKSEDVGVSFTLEEDEGLDIRDSNSSINKGDYSNAGHHYPQFNSDSSNGNSDTEISENLDSVELSEVSVEFSDISLKDGTQTCTTEDSRKLKSKEAKEAKKKRFRRLIRKPVIKRSQSLGCEKDLVPEHALFLQFNPAEIHGKDTGRKEHNDPQRRTIYKTSSADAAMMAQELLPVDTQDLAKSKPISSIAKNVKRKLQKLHRRNTDSFLGAAIMSVRGTKVTQAEALEWGNSFESLLMDKNGLEMFKNFLKSEFSEENIEFWIACEEFKTTRTNKLTTRAQKIYSDFVAVNAPKQINLDSKTRLETVTNLENPTRDLFHQAQKRIQFLMENDSYKRFLETDEYKNLVSTPTGGTT